MLPAVSHFCIVYLLLLILAAAAKLLPLLQPAAAAMLWYWSLTRSENIVLAVGVSRNDISREMIHTLACSTVHSRQCMHETIQ